MVSSNEVLHPLVISSELDLLAFGAGCRARCCLLCFYHLLCYWRCCFLLGGAGCRAGCLALLPTWPPARSPASLQDLRSQRSKNGSNRRFRHTLERGESARRALRSLRSRDRTPAHARRRRRFARPKPRGSAH